jgi:hypothetical protein
LVADFLAGAAAFFTTVFAMSVSGFQSRPNSPKRFLKDTSNQTEKSITVIFPGGV